MAYLLTELDTCVGITCCAVSGKADCDLVDEDLGLAQAWCVALLGQL